MNKTKNPRAPGHMTRKDSIACGVVLASILVTMACGAIVVGASTDSPQRYAQASTEVIHD
jgi:hypothetical protein